MSPLIGWLASLLLHATWIAAVAALAVWVLLRWARDPRIVHGVTAGGLLLIASALLAVGVATWPRTPERMVVAAPVAVTTAPVQTQSMQMPPVATTGPAVVAVPAPPDWRAWTVLAWCCGVMVMSLRHAGGWWRALRLRRTATRITGELHDRLAALCRTAGATVPLLLASTRLAVPSAIGWWRPAILIPAGLLTGLPPAQLDALILHELAHLRRHDWLIEIAVSVLECLLFFHPAVWWLGRRLRQAREQCCDGFAVRAGAEPSGLARALLALAERTAPGSPALAATGGALADRVRRILGLPEQRQRPWRALVAIAMLPVVLVVVTACATAARNELAKVEAVHHEMTVSETSDRQFPLARRIRALADGRQVEITSRMAVASPAFWRSLGIAGDRPVHLSSEAAARVLHGISDKVHFEPRAALAGLRSCSFVSLNKKLFNSDCEIPEGRVVPIEAVLDFGQTQHIRVEPTQRGVLLVEAHVVDRQLLGLEKMTASWSSNGITTSCRIDVPVILAGEIRLDPDTVIAPGEAVALPAPRHFVRMLPSLRSDVELSDRSDHIAAPDMEMQPLRVCIISAKALPEVASRLIPTPAAADWLDATRVHVDVQNAPMDEVIRSLAAQLPVAIEVCKDEDYAATRVSLRANGEKARTVIDALLAQCLLSGRANAGLLRLAPHDVWTRLSVGFPSPPDVARSGSVGFDTFPGPAWEAPIEKRYDIRDLLFTSFSRESPDILNDQWIVKPDFASKGDRLYADIDAAAATLQDAICAATWSDGRGRGLSTDGGGLIVHAAPVVHRAIEDDIRHRRMVNADLIHIKLNLVRIQPQRWKELGTGDVAMWPHDVDGLLRRRIEAEANAFGEQPQQLEVTLGNGRRYDMRPSSRGWWADSVFEVVPAMSSDRKRIHIEVRSAMRSMHLDNDGKNLPSMMRFTISMSSDGGSQIMRISNDVGLIIDASAIFSDPIEP